MPAIPLQNIDDFVESVLHKYVKTDWKDISIPLRKCVFADRIFNRVKADEMEGDEVHWKLQFANPGNFRLIAPYSELETKRVDMLTHGQMFWSMNETNYNYCILEPEFRTTKVRIIDALDVAEHGMWNDYFLGVEKLMMGPGPTTIATAGQPTPPASLLWWLQPYNSALSPITLSVGTDAVSSGFVGMDPPGFSSVGTGGVFSSIVPGWRNRAGIYTSVTPTDMVDTMIECIDKCAFTPVKNYPELAPGEKPDWEILTTYSRIKATRRILQSGNDNINGDLSTHKGTVMVNGVTMREVPIWSNQELGLALTTGTILGVNWSTWKYYFKSGFRQQKMPPIIHPTMPDVRIRRMLDSGQIVCFDRRANWRLDCTVPVVEFD
jgi:hypothetical protein